MENMSQSVKRVIDYYGFNCDSNGRTVVVSSPNGEIVFRRINNTQYRVYGDARRVVSVNVLIAKMVEVL
nr:MAG TPA: RHS protein [Caudoviricetes sp.]